MLDGAITGSLVGMAIGEAIGMSYDGLDGQQLSDRLKDVGDYHAFAGKGFSAGNTDLAVMTCQAVIESGLNSTLFRQKIASKMRPWVLTCPAYISEGARLSALKLLTGVPASKCGRFSAGTSSLMRAPVIGLCYLGDGTNFSRMVRESTTLTHTDPKALYGAIAISLATATAAERGEVDIGAYGRQFADLTEGLDTYEIVNLIKKAYIAAKKGLSTKAFAMAIGLKNGSTPYVCHTVPLVLHAWFLHPKDFRAGVDGLIECGGNTASLCALYGAVVGACLGLDGMPGALLKGYADPVKSITALKSLASQVASMVTNKGKGKSSDLPYPKLFLVNMLIWSWVARVIIQKLCTRFKKQLGAERRLN